MKEPLPNNYNKPDFSWSDIEMIFLDMDGTLLDKYFDDYFWEHHVPQVYAVKNNIGEKDAKQQLMARYKSVEDTLEWTDIMYWSSQLGLDIPALKHQLRHLIQVHPHAIDFLNHLKKLGKNIALVTAAHPKTLEIKMNETNLDSYFDRLICTDEVGLPKEDPRFWQELETIIPFDKSRTLLADDTQKVLESAHIHGIRELVFMAKPSSRRQPNFSSRFSSIISFDELVF